MKINNMLFVASLKFCYIIFCNSLFVDRQQNKLFKNYYIQFKNLCKNIVFYYMKCSCLFVCCYIIRYIVKFFKSVYALLFKVVKNVLIYNYNISLIVDGLLLVCLICVKQLLSLLCQIKYYDNIYIVNFFNFWLYIYVDVIYVRKLINSKQIKTLRGKL